MLDKLKDKFNQIKQKDKDLFLFGSKSHKYKSNPASPEAIKKLEAYFNCQLPEEYKTFLLQIGSGMGPGHKLFSPSEIMANPAGWQKYGDETNDDFDFPIEDWHVEDFQSITQQDLSKIENNLSQEPNNYLYESSPHIKFPDGAIIISEDGCDYFTALIVKGELKGTIWSVESHYKAWPTGFYRYDNTNVSISEAGVVRNEGNYSLVIKPYTFLQWIEEWAVNYLSASLQIKN